MQVDPNNAKSPDCPILRDDLARSRVEPLDEPFEVDIWNASRDLPCLSSPADPDG
jgi:hypothetical protein